MQCLDPSEQLAAIVVISGHAIVYFSLTLRFCIIVLQDALKKLANIPRIGDYYREGR